MTFDPVTGVGVISIHAPHAGCDQSCSYVARYVVFQSTHPMRGATKRSQFFQRRRLDFNPRTPCGVRPAKLGKQTHSYQFQSTHPMRGATICCEKTVWCFTYFNPRTPCGVRQQQALQSAQMTAISIHAPHAGCDASCRAFFIGLPRFQSTHPMRGATPRLPFPRVHRRYFNPRTPCGVRLHCRTSWRSG